MKVNQLKPWQQKMWCVGQLDAGYIAQMEHIPYADRYSRPFASSDILGLHSHQTPSRATYLTEPYRVSTFHFYDRWRVRSLPYTGDASPTIPYL